MFYILSIIDLYFGNLFGLLQRESPLRDSHKPPRLKLYIQLEYDAPTFIVNPYLTYERASDELLRPEV